MLVCLSVSGIINAQDQGDTIIPGSMCCDSVKAKADREKILGATCLDNYDRVAAFTHFQNAQELYRCVGDTTNQANMWYEMGWLLAYDNQNLPEAVTYLTNALDIYSKNSKYLLNELDLILDLRQLYYKNNYAKEYASLTLVFNKKLSEVTSVVDKLELLGRDQNILGNSDKALEFYTKAREHMEDEGLRAEVLQQYHRICTSQLQLLLSTKNYQEAIAKCNLLLEFEHKYNQRESFVLIPQVYVRSMINLGYDEEEISAYINNLSEQFYKYDAAQRKACLLTVDTYMELHEYEKVLHSAAIADSIFASRMPETAYERLHILECKIKAQSWLDRFDEAISNQKNLMQLKDYEDNLEGLKKDLRQLANYEAFSGAAGNEHHREDAKRHMAQSVDMEIDAIKQQAPWLTPEQRTNLWEKVQYNLQQISGFAVGLKACRDDFTADAYNAHVLASGLLLQTEKSMTEAIRNQGTAEDNLLLDELTSLKEFSGRDDNKVDAEVQLRIQTIESKLIQNTAELANYTKFLAIDFNAIHKNLLPGEVLVDFLENKHTENDDSSVLAFILRSEWKHPHLLRVCRYSEINSISETLDARIYEDDKSLDMRRLLMDSVLHYVNPGERILYVPAGIVHGISIDNLSTDDGRHLSEVYDMIRLSSARELIDFHERQWTPHTAVLYGGLNYGDYSENEISEVLDSSQANSERGLAEAFTKLQTSLYEVKDIRALLKKSSVASVLYDQDDGTEESFLAFDGQSPDIIHMATHGYYLTSENAHKVKGLEGYTKAMQLSGLVMSGGNSGWLGLPTKNGALEGLLSAEDISKLDLSNTQLVVLSACKTAKGTTSPEGIFGLQRAFKKAGAGTLVMTLWNVSDKVTALFMKEFYKELVKHKWDTHTAFENAKNFIRSNKKYEEPYYWAGFIILD